MPERFGYVGVISGATKTIWLHAVSVGEIQAAIPLVRALQTAYPDDQILVTTVTPTGAAHARRVFGAAVQHRYLPYDIPICISRFLNSINPAVMLVMETELWPNLFKQCRDRGIPVAIINARLSARSARRYRLLTGFTRQLLGQVSLIACRSAMDAQRFQALGATDEQIKITGNIKFDLEIHDSNRDKSNIIRQQLLGNRPVWIAASTHQGEEEMVLSAHRDVLRVFPEALLVLAPRHPERSAEIRALIENHDFSVISHSSGAHCPAETNVIYLLDTLGELRGFFDRVDVVFMGGSLVDVGGHNMLEPAASGRAILTGPHVYNFEEIARELFLIRGALITRTAPELARQVIMLLSDEQERTAMGGRAREFVHQSRGSTDRVMLLISPWLTH